MSGSSFDYLGGNYYISAASLLLEYRNFIDSHPVLFKINVAHPCWPQLVLYCKELEQNVDIMRTITRIHTSSQTEFERALFCSWGSLLVARSLRLDISHQRALFYAGLLQDLGKHALDEQVEEVVSKLNVSFLANAHSDVEHRHALLSSTYLEGILTDVDSINDLILNHHAKDDGTGYPNHISESQLNIDNQILIVANEISDRLDQFGGHNQIIQILPSLKLGRLLYFAKAQNAWLSLLAPHTAQNQLGDEYISSDELKSKGLKLEKLLSCLLCVSSDLLPYDFNLTVHGLRSMIRKLAGLFNDSGIFETSIFESAKTIPEEVMAELHFLFKGLPEILLRCMNFVDDILNSKKYDSTINLGLLNECRILLHKNIKTLEGNRRSIFR